MKLIDVDEFASNLERISEMNGVTIINIDMLINHFKSMPSIDPVRHGHWCDLEDEENEMEVYHCSCSECGDIAYGKADTVKQFKLYCSHCGALMDGE